MPAPFRWHDQLAKCGAGLVHSDAALYHPGVPCALRYDQFTVCVWSVVSCMHAFRGGFNGELGVPVYSPVNSKSCAGLFFTERYLGEVCLFAACVSLFFWGVFCWC